MNTLEKRSAAQALRDQGLTFLAIARHLGISVTQAYRYVRRPLRTRSCPGCGRQVIGLGRQVYCQVPCRARHAVLRKTPSPLLVGERPSQSPGDGEVA